MNWSTDFLKEMPLAHELHKLSIHVFYLRNIFVEISVISGQNLSGQELIWKRIPKDYRLSDRSIIT